MVEQISFANSEYIIAKDEVASDFAHETRDLLRRGVFDPRYLSFLQQGYDQNIRDPNWFREVFRSYLDLVRRSEPAAFEDDRKSYADYCNFPAELSRIREAKRNKKNKKDGSFESVAQVLHVADTNLQTLVNELLLGASTRYGYKLVLHPQTNEKKVVFYDSMTNAGEGWESAWSREDVRISFLRSVDHTAAHLQMREWVNLYVFNSLCDKWERNINDDDANREQYFWVSPPPSGAGFGYGTITLGYVYSPFKSGDNEITIPARTIISEYSTAYFRQLALDIASQEDSEWLRVKSLPDDPSDIDLLSLPYKISDDFVDYNLQVFVDKTEKRLDSYSNYHKLYPNHRKRQIKHSQSRIIDDFKVDVFQRKLKWKRLKYKVALYTERPPEKLRRFVADDYQVSAEKIFRKLREKDWEENLKNRGVVITAEMRRENKKEVMQTIMQRQENGSCPTALRKMKTITVKNAQGEDVEIEVDDNNDEICLIKCKNVWFDEFTNREVSCTWNTKPTKDPSLQHKYCPCCGWNPDMDTTIVVQERLGLLNKHNQINPPKISDLNSDANLNRYFKTDDDELTDERNNYLFERSKKPLSNNAYIDFDRREVVYMIGFISIRRKVSERVLYAAA